MNLDIIFRILASFLEGFRREDIVFAIKRDIDLKKIMDKTQPQVIVGLIAFVKATKLFNKIIEDEFTYENVMIWMKDNRQELHDEIRSTKLGVIWFRKNVAAIKDMLLNGD